MRAATRLILIRHGHTASNSSGGLRMSGWTDTSLSDQGRRQVACLARRMASEPASILYASPLLRALETARPVAQAAGAEIRLEPCLREIHCGEVDGWPTRASAGPAARPTGSFGSEASTPSAVSPRPILASGSSS